MMAVNLMLPLILEKLERDHIKSKKLINDARTAGIKVVKDPSGRMLDIEDAHDMVDLENIKRDIMNDEKAKNALIRFVFNTTSEQAATAKMSGLPYFITATKTKKELEQS